MNKIYTFLLLSLLSLCIYGQTVVDNPCNVGSQPNWPLDGVCYTANTTSMTNLFNPGTCNSGLYDDGWVTFTGDGNNLTISYDPTIRDAILHVMEATAPCTTSPVGCSDSGGNGVIETISLVPSVFGQVYFARIQRKNSNALMDGCLSITSSPSSTPSISLPVLGAQAGTTISVCVDGTNTFFTSVSGTIQSYIVGDVTGDTIFFSSVDTSGITDSTICFFYDIPCNFPGGQLWTFYTNDGIHNLMSDGGFQPIILGDAFFLYPDFCPTVGQAAPTNDTAGTWSFDPNPFDGSTINAFSGVVQNAVGGSTYTIKYVDACAVDSLSLAVNVLTMPNPGLGGSITLCSSDGSTDLFNELSGADVGGTWYPSMNSGTGVFDPSIDPDGVYAYVVSCSDAWGTTNDTATVTVTVNVASNAGTPGNHTFCPGGIGNNLFSFLGGNPDTTGTWSGPSVLSGGYLGFFDPIIHNAGMYTYTVNGTPPCTSDNSNVTITISAPLNLSPNITHDNGTGAGAIDLTISGGTSPYNVSWSNGAITEDINSLNSGTYIATVTDVNGCTDTISATVNDICNMSVSVNNVGASCGLANGSASANISGGTAPFSYYWSNGDLASTADSLFAGIYIITVTDTNGCVAYGNATINNSAGPSILSNILAVSCDGNNDGSIDITVTGGAIPYAFSWSNAATTEDISNITSGIYQVQVTDAAGCIANSSITVNSPNPISITTTPIDASCGMSNGSVSASVSGGTPGYNYLWSSGGTSSNETGLTNDIYTIIVTDTNGCIDSTSVAVNETNGPVIFSDSTTATSCGGLGSAYITAYGTSPFTYLWSNGAITQDLIGVVSGTYQVQVSDSGGCSSNLNVIIGNTQPLPNEICAVTVDSITNTNTLIWEKSGVGMDIASFNIYKEGFVVNQFDLIGNVHVDSLSEFNDPNSNPDQRSWRYKISTVDSCGTESVLSSVHKTIHLIVSQGQGNDYNLFWNHYEGFSFGTYYIHRYQPSTGWQLIDSLPSNLNTYTDFSLPQGNVFYNIEAKHPFGCTSTEANSHNSVRSNKKNVASGAPIGIAELNKESRFVIYPNPANDFVMVKSKDSGNYEIEILDISGKLIFKLNNQMDETRVNVSGLSSGMYLVKIAGDNNIELLKLIIENNH